MFFLNTCGPGPQKSDRERSGVLPCKDKSEKPVDCKQVTPTAHTNMVSITLHPTIGQSHCCTGTWSVFTYLLLTVSAFTLNNFLPNSERDIVLLFPLV